MKFLIKTIMTLFLIVEIYSIAMAANFNMNPGTVSGGYTFLPGSYNGPTGQGSLWATGGILGEWDMELESMSDADTDGWNMDQAEPISWGYDGMSYYVSEYNLDAPWPWYGPPGVHSTSSAVELDLINMHLGIIWVNMANWNWNWNGVSNVGLGRGLDGYAGNADDWAVMRWGNDSAWGGGDDTLWYQAVSPQFQVPPPPWEIVLISKYYELYLEGSFSSPDSPTLSGFWPGDGPPNTFVYVFGSNFVAPVGTQVSINGINSSAVAVVDENMLIFMLPVGNTIGPIVVTTDQGSALISGFGVPLVGLNITGIWPAQGPVYKLVYVFGSGFVLAQTTVAVNGISSPAVAVVDENMLIFMVPSGATTGPITITTPSDSVTSDLDFVVIP